jgi:hypothetical protein
VWCLLVRSEPAGLAACQHNCFGGLPTSVPSCVDRLLGNLFISPQLVVFGVARMFNVGDGQLVHGKGSQWNVKWTVNRR